MDSTSSYGTPVLPTKHILQSGDEFGFNPVKSTPWDRFDNSEHDYSQLPFMQASLQVFLFSSLFL